MKHPTFDFTCSHCKVTTKTEHKFEVFEDKEVKKENKRKKEECDQENKAIEMENEKAKKEYQDALKKYEHYYEYRTTLFGRIIEIRKKRDDVAFYLLTNHYDLYEKKYGGPRRYHIRFYYYMPETYIICPVCDKKNYF